jgi:hypothetical protein
MNMVPSYGNTGEQTTATLIDAMLKRSHMMQQANAGKHTALLDAQTADLGRAADGRTVMMQNIDKIAEVLGHGPAMDILTRQYDPARPMDASTPNMQAAAAYGPEADRLRLFESFGRGTKDVGSGIANLVGAGQLPDMSLIPSNRLQDFTSVPRNGQLGGGGGRGGDSLNPASLFTKQIYYAKDQSGSIVTINGSPVMGMSLEEARNNLVMSGPMIDDKGRNVSDLYGEVFFVPMPLTRDNQTPAGFGQPVPAATFDTQALHNFAINGDEYGG